MLPVGNYVLLLPDYGQVSGQPVRDGRGGEGGSVGSEEELEEEGRQALLHLGRKGKKQSSRKDSFYGGVIEKGGKEKCV